MLTAGERHEQFALDALMDKGAVPRQGRGRPRLRPRRTAGDRVYSTPPVRRRLRQRRIEPVISTRTDQPRQTAFDKAAYGERKKVERLIGRLKQYRRIATRYEKRAATHLAMVTLGMTMLWLT
ncbi:IS5 family transposase ISMra2 [Methylorubrum podarium]|jgi:transposase|nr:IS5 family transposase ISMra2 [Methylorubrum podarium]